MDIIGESLLTSMSTYVHMYVCKFKFKTENVRKLLEFHTRSAHQTVPLEFVDIGFKEGGWSGLAFDWLHRICFHVCIL